MNLLISVQQCIVLSRSLCCWLAGRAIYMPVCVWAVLMHTQKKRNGKKNNIFGLHFGFLCLDF